MELIIDSMLAPSPPLVVSTNTMLAAHMACALLTVVAMKSAVPGSMSALSEAT